MAMAAWLQRFLLRAAILSRRPWLPVLGKPRQEGHGGQADDGSFPLVVDESGFDIPRGVA